MGKGKEQAQQQGTEASSIGCQDHDVSWKLICRFALSLSLFWIYQTRIDIELLGVHDQGGIMQSALTFVSLDEIHHLTTICGSSWFQL